MYTSKSKIADLVVVLGAVCVITYLSRYVSLVSNSTVQFLVSCLSIALLAVPAVVVYKYRGNSIGQLFQCRSWLNILFALIILATLLVLFVAVPSIFEISIIGSAESFSWAVLLADAVQLIIFVGFVEEFIFRVFVQDILLQLMPKLPWLAIVLQAVLFGFWHLINGNMAQVLFTTIIGFIIGAYKYKCNNCNYISVAVGHGMYDFMLTVVRMFLL